MRQAAPGPVTLGGGEGYREGNRRGITWQLRRSYSYVHYRKNFYLKLTIEVESIVSFFPHSRTILQSLVDLAKHGQ